MNQKLNVADYSWDELWIVFYWILVIGFILCFCFGLFIKTEPVYLAIISLATVSIINTLRIKKLEMKK